MHQIAKGNAINLELNFDVNWILIHCKNAAVIETMLN